MSTPFISLGSEPLSAALLSEVEVRQQLNAHWTCRVVLRDSPDRRPPVEDYAGQELKISTFDLDGTETIVFQGPVQHMRLIYEVTGAWGAELEAVSATWTMAQGKRLKYFRQQTAAATAQAILSNAGLALVGSMPAGPNLSYVQWAETDFDFTARLIDDVEAWFRPAVDGSGGLEVQTGFADGTAVNWREGEYGLLEWTTRGRLLPVTAEGAHYDFQAMQSQVYAGTAGTVPMFSHAAANMVAAAQAASGSVEPIWADRHRAATLSDLQQRLQREARRGMANAVVCTGVSRNPKVRAGDTLLVTGLPEVDATYGVIAAKHVWTPKGYENTFTVTPAQKWSPPVRPQRPLLDGVYPARVVDNHDPHNEGRIRVQYYWQEGNQSTWVRLLSGHAGPGRGMLFYPEVGDEVMVTFEEGDAERPCIVGSAWNGVHQPPASGFHQPGEVNGSEFAANNIKRIVTKSGHRITMVDTPGKETISVATPTNNRLMLTENHNDTGRPAILLETQGDMILAAPNGRIHTQSMYHSRQVGVGEPTAVVQRTTPQARLVQAADHPATIRPQPVADTKYDGCLIGRGCEPLTSKQQPGQHLSDDQIKGAWKSAYHSDSSCCQARRAAGQAPKRVVYVNGIRTDKAGQCYTLKKIANQSCADVIGVHNATEGTVDDLFQSRKDRSLIDQARAGRPFAVHDGRNPAVDSMSDVIYNSVLDGNPPEIWAHSQGGAIASLASYDADNGLKAGNYTPGVAGVQVKSFASAAQNWPPTMSGQHFINIQDLVPVETGLGADPALDSAATGLKQKVIRFEGAPGASNPMILTPSQLQELNKTSVYPGDPPIVLSNLPPEGVTAYHDVNTTYLNAARKVDGGCSPDGN